MVLATQSPRLVDEFDPGDIVVMDTREEKGTTCRRLNPGDLAEWLEEYSLGELWRKKPLRRGGLDGSSHRAG